VASLNKVLLVGHLGRDPDVRVTAQGAPICNLSLATSERFKDKTGESREVTEWHRVVLYRRLAEVARKLGTPGYMVDRAEDLQPHRVYNVRQGVWHTHTLSPDAKVLVVENQDTTWDNSPFTPLAEAQMGEIVHLTRALWADAEG